MPSPRIVDQVYSAVSQTWGQGFNYSATLGRDNLIVAMFVSEGTTEAGTEITSATLGGEAMTLLATETVQDGATWLRVSVFYLLEADFPSFAPPWFFSVSTSNSGTTGHAVAVFTLEGSAQGGAVDLPINTYSAIDAVTSWLTNVTLDGSECRGIIVDGLEDDSVTGTPSAPVGIVELIDDGVGPSRFLSSTAAVVGTGVVGVEYTYSSLVTQRVRACLRSKGSIQESTNEPVYLSSSAGSTGGSGGANSLTLTAVDLGLGNTERTGILFVHTKGNNVSETGGLSATLGGVAMTLLAEVTSSDPNSFHTRLTAFYIAEADIPAGATADVVISKATNSQGIKASFVMTEGGKQTSAPSFSSNGENFPTAAGIPWENIATVTASDTLVVDALGYDANNSADPVWPQAQRAEVTDSGGGVSTSTLAIANTGPLEMSWISSTSIRATWIGVNIEAASAGADVELDGSASGETDADGSALAVDTTLAGTTNGETTTSAELTISSAIELDGSASGETDADGAALAVDTTLAGTTNGETTVDGEITVTGPVDLDGVVTGETTVDPAGLEVDTALVGSSDGETTLTGELDVGDFSLIHLINRNPEPGESDVVASANIALDIANTGAGGINLNETRVFVDGVIAFNNGSFEPGFDGSASTTISVGVNGDTERIVIDPTGDFDSTALVEVCVETENGDGSISLSTCYTFTVEDLTPPGIFEVVATDLDTVEVRFTEPVDDTALVAGNYTFAAVVDPERLLCVAEVSAFSVRRVSADAIEITTDVELSHGRFYELTVENVSDVEGNVIPATTVQFVAFEPAQPTGRDFDLWTWIPELNRREDDDGTGDLRRWICIVQECADLLLFSIDRWTRILDVDVAPEAFLDAMLDDLGNPFTSFVLDVVDKRRLARVLVEIYRQKGLAKGIKNVVRFFLGIEIEILPFEADGMELGISELGIDWILGSSSQRDLYTFNVEVPVNLTDEERRRLLQIIDYMKPAHTHLGQLIEPEIPEVFDHWELGFSELGETTLLH